MPPEVQNILQEEVTKQTDWMHSVMKEMDEKDYAELPEEKCRALQVARPGTGTLGKSIGAV